MKKMNGIDTLSAHQQMAIRQWYTISVRILTTLLAALTAVTLTQFYFYRRYAPSCKPCMSKSYADAINKKHTEKTGCTRNKKLIVTEREHGAKLATNYAALIQLHTEVSPAHLADLRLTTHGLTAHYTVNNRAAVQHMIDHLQTSSAIQKASLESIEQKNNQSSCTIQASWKK